MRAPQSERTAKSELPVIAADMLERLRARRPRVHCITNAVAQNFTANMLLAAGAVPSMTIARQGGEGVRRARRRAADQSRHLRSGAAEGVARRDRRRQQARHSLGARSGVHRPLAAARGVRQETAGTQARGAAAERAPSSARCRAAKYDKNTKEIDDAALARFAKARRTVVGLTGAQRLRARRLAARHHRQRPSADGAGHRDGLRRLGAGRRLSRGRARCLEGRRRGADHHRRRRARSRPSGRGAPAASPCEILDAVYALDARHARRNGQR